MEPGTRLRITLPQGRGWQHFAATVKRIDFRSDPREDVEDVEMVVFPVVDGPHAEDGRRAFHRVSLAEATPFPIQRQRLTEQLRREAHLLDLSAGGFGAVLTEPITVGDLFRVELPLGEWCAPLEAEVVHCRPVRGSTSTWQAGFRLVGITERHRSLVQREVLRRERAQMPRRRGYERMDPTAA
jgi:c-di-GMP-binding flagellar brake protein YcgR